jgi:PAS domain S-box-containing protein
MRAEPLQDDGDLILYRGRRGSGGVLAAVPARDPPPADTLERLVHEFALKDQLESDWAARPLELVRRQGRTALVREDPGGLPLARLLGRPMETGRFLRLAIALAEAVGKVHERGLIHRDLRPANILADEAPGAVRLTGFGLASRLPRERPAPDQAEPVAGSLPYMAPEQTGRMNRSVDTRSDLYAVGVILYEMLTGAPPFQANEPIEWFHSHIARAPQPPAERLPGAPEAISAIIMKCLAKTAEDRYQTAAGLAADLKRCLAEWESTGRIAPFAPGAQDIPDTLRVPEKLYGREAEVARLLAAFGRVTADASLELVLVSGYSGVGKSSVVSELHKALVPPRGLFAAGKFDQYKRDIPYSTLAQAFQGLIRPLLGKSPAELARWREDLRAALEPNGALMVTLVPDLELVIGEQPPVPDLPAQDADHRFRKVVRRFIGVFARPEHPLALFLDDLQWLDSATLTLLVDLATRPDAGPLLLVGAYRDNEVGPAHPLMRSLDAIREAGGRVSDIVLAPLARGDVGRLVSDSLHCSEAAARPLTDLVYEKTGGNPFFAIQFLTALCEEGLLSVDPAAGRWVWDLDRIRAKGYTDNIVDLMVGKLARLPEETREALQQLAALGASADFATLSLVLERPAAAVHVVLFDAVRAGLVLRQDEAYAFIHDRVQEAAYSLIPEAQRAAAHLHIGRILASSLSHAEVDAQIFEVVNQLNRGSALVETQDERDRIAELDLSAGRRAKSSTAYTAALNYFACGAALLAEDRWRRRYDLAFPLDLNLGDCECMTGDMEGADRRLAALWNRAQNTADRAAVACLRLVLYTTMDRSDLAVDVCLEYLRQVGLEWTAHPADAEVAREYELMWAQIGERPIASLVDLPLMTDPDRRATMNVLGDLISPALLTDRNLHALVVGRMVNLSLEYGNCDGSCFGYIWAGGVMEATFENAAACSSFGRLACDLVDERGLDRYKARVYVGSGTLIAPWTKPFRSGMPIARGGFETAQKSGDLNFASYASYFLVTLMLALGEPLARTQEEAERALAFVRDARFGIVSDIVTVQLRLVRRLRGLTPSFICFDDYEFSENRLERRFACDYRLAWAACFYWIRKLQACVFAEDHESAVEAADNAEALLWTSSWFFEAAEFHFYAALARAALCRSDPGEERDRCVASLNIHAGKLRAWAQGCPENFDNRVFLVDAEIARIEGRDLEAMRLYEQAVRSARENDLVHNEALSNELAGRYYLDRGFETNGLAHLREARAGYLRWGAEGKVRQLDRRHPGLAAHAPAAPAESALRRLDVATLVKAWQAVSAEIALPGLMETLMSITLQNAGADRGLLLLPCGDGFEIAAEARTVGAAVDVRLRHSVMTCDDGPEAVVNTVIRTRERALLDDGERPGPGWEDSASCYALPRSAFCLPLLRQGRLAGALYLENSQAAYAFTPERVAVLEVLGAQAAIAIENARLYSDLQDRETKIRRLVDANIIGIILWSSDGAILDANDAFLAMVGYDRQDLQSGRLSWTSMTPREWRDADAQIMTELKAKGSHPPFEKEYIRKDGRRVPVLVGPATFSANPDEGVAFILDLTERKEAEQLQKVMVDELNHRVKNTLATVMAISAQTLRTSPSPEAFRKAFQGRLIALSKTHDLLNRACWTSVSLHDLLKQALAPHGQDGRFVLDGPQVRLGPVAAVTVGMALHELATNAAKYGALSTPKGRVRVTWRPAEEGRVRLEWVESGGPRVQPPSRRGFGSELIEKVLSSELRGDVALEFPPEGVRCVMDMELERVSTLEGRGPHAEGQRLGRTADSRCRGRTGRGLGSRRDAGEPRLRGGGTRLRPAARRDAEPGGERAQRRDSRRQPRQGEGVSAGGRARARAGPVLLRDWLRSGGLASQRPRPPDPAEARRPRSHRADDRTLAALGGARRAPQIRFSRARRPRW